VAVRAAFLDVGNTLAGEEPSQAAFVVDDLTVLPSTLASVP
jgi:hypothetical protein